MTVSQNKFEVELRYRLGDDDLSDEALMDMLNNILRLASEFPNLKATHCKHYSKEGQRFIHVIVEDGEEV